MAENGFLYLGKFPKLRNALERFEKPGGNYTRALHNLGKGEIVEPHKHPKANEYLIIIKGRLMVWAGGNIYIVGSNPPDTKESEAAFDLLQFPAGTIHAVKAMTDVKYRVYKDVKNDRTIKEKNITIDW